MTQRFLLLRGKAGEVAEDEFGSINSRTVALAVRDALQERSSNGVEWRIIEAGDPKRRDVEWGEGER